MNSLYQPPQADLISVEQRVNDRDETPWDEHRSFLVLLHLSPLAILILNLLGYAAPFLCWALRKSEHPVIDRQGKEVLNFHFTLLLFYIATAAFVTIVGVAKSFVLSISGLVILLQFMLMFGGSASVYKGKEFEYPLSIKFLKY